MRHQLGHSVSLSERAEQKVPALLILRVFQKPRHGMPAF